MDNSRNPPAAFEATTTPGYQHGDGSNIRNPTHQQIFPPLQFADGGDYSDLIMGISSTQGNQPPVQWDNFDPQEGFDGTTARELDDGGESQFDFSQFIHGDPDPSTPEIPKDSIAKDYDDSVERLSGAAHVREQNGHAQSTQQQSTAPLSGLPSNFNPTPSFNRASNLKPPLNAWPAQYSRAPGLQDNLYQSASAQIPYSYGSSPSNAAIAGPMLGHPVHTRQQPAFEAPQVQTHRPFSVVLELENEHLTPRKGREPTNFPDLQASIRHPQYGFQCEGTYKQLFNQYPVLRSEIQKRHSVWESGEVHQTDVRPHKGARKNTPLVKLSSKTDSRAQQATPNSGIEREQLIDTSATTPVESCASTSMSPLYASPRPHIHSNDHIFHAAAPVSGDTVFDLEHESIDAALEYIERPPAEVCEKLEIERDDWEDFANFSNKFKSHCHQLFDALRQPGGAVPNTYNQEQKTEYEMKHTFVRTQVLESMQTPEQIRAVKARVIKAMSMIVRVHEVGIPRATLQATKKARGYNLDTRSTCQQRTQKVISAASTSKYVARDILKSENLAQIALSPDEYLKKKFSNSGGNKTRGEKIKAATAARRDNTEAAAATVVGETSQSNAIYEIAAPSVLSNAFQGDLQSQGIGFTAGAPSDIDFHFQPRELTQTRPDIMTNRGAETPEVSPWNDLNSRKRHRSAEEDDVESAEKPQKLARF